MLCRWRRGLGAFYVFGIVAFGCPAVWCAEESHFGIVNPWAGIHGTGTKSLCCGADEPKEWTVRVSRDNENWEVVAHGPGDPALRTIDLTKYVPGKLWLRLKGDNVELYSVLLETVSGDGE
jgi:hypothetical protein